MIKNEIRKMMLERRNTSSKKELNRKNKSIIQEILADDRFKRAETVAIYYPMGNEVNLLTLMKDHKRFAFPKVEPDGIHFYVFDPHVKFVKSKFGVMEPPQGELVDDQIDYMLAPALAISKDLYRVGFGKGYYDQFLSKHRPRTVIGVIYDFQELDTIPFDDHDQKLDGYMKGHL
jgi:5-formyltetrahydrofolate cyclo-ligase